MSRSSGPELPALIGVSVQLDKSCHYEYCGNQMEWFRQSIYTYQNRYVSLVAYAPSSISVLVICVTGASMNMCFLSGSWTQGEAANEHSMSRMDKKQGIWWVLDFSINPNITALQCSSACDGNVTASLHFLVASLPDCFGEIVI